MNSETVSAIVGEMMDGRTVVITGGTVRDRDRAQVDIARYLYDRCLPVSRSNGSSGSATFRSYISGGSITVQSDLRGTSCDSVYILVSEHHNAVTATQTSEDPRVVFAQHA